MDDLAGLDWSSSATNNNNKSLNGSSTTPSYAFTSFKSASPALSGRSTPVSLSAQQSNSKPISATTSKPGTPANDSFSNLFSSRKPADRNAGLSMQERQKLLMEEKASKEQERQRQFANQFGNSDDAWGSIGSGKSTPGVATPSLPYPAPQSVSQTKSLSDTINKPFTAISRQRSDHNSQLTQSTSEGDLLADFDSDAPVDSSTHFPASFVNDSRSSTPAVRLDGFDSVGQSTLSSSRLQDDDDPFGLGSMPEKRAPSATSVQQAEDDDDNDDDVLGLLGKPVTSKPLPIQRQEAASLPLSTSDSGTPPESSFDPRDRAVASLVDMGFPADKAAEALSHTDYNESAAVSFLLNAAHEDSRSRSQSSKPQRRGSPFDEDTDRASRGERQDPNMPAWMRDEDALQSSSRRQDSRSPAPEKVAAQYAQEFGASFLKGANSLWKAGKKNVQRAVADFNQDATSTLGEPNQPKWMRNASPMERDEANFARQPENRTDEAMLLEGGSRPQKPQRHPAPEQPRERVDAFHDDFSDALPERPIAMPRPQSPPKNRQFPAYAAPQASSRKFKFDDDETVEVYTSSARRRTPASSTPRTSSPIPVQQPAKPTSSALNGFAPSPNSSSRTTTETPSRPSPAITHRPKAPMRQIPPVSSSALSTSATHRNTGSEAFRRGDYVSAHASYSSALTSLASPSHPIVIIILCNRAATSLKTGDPKAAVSDADQALQIIGPSRGHDEQIALEDGSNKQMREFYGKALMRKAEGFEHMEKWSDALTVWKLAVEAGVGGAVSMQGRQRCEKAAGGGVTAAKPPVAAPASRRAAPAKPIARVQPNVSSAASVEAVKKLREANAAAERADDEKFRLSDTVDAKLTEWKGSKADNLRALLSSLDKVLWPEAGWKKAGMQDLVLPNKVKIVYMKAIAKVHPDKIPQDATTEQRMISAAVFSVLNEAWDKFKKENGL